MRGSRPDRSTSCQVRAVGRELARWRGPATVYLVLGLALWPVPVVGLLHAEASAVVAAAAFFVAAWSGAGRFEAGASVRRVAGAHLALLAIPWALLTATLLWRPNCAYATGALLYLVLVPPSAVLGVALAWASTARLGLRAARALSVGAGLALAAGGVAYDLGLHPQLFTYNHVFGGVLGPVYDAELAIRPGLFAFRGLTLLWAAALVVIGRMLRGQGGGRALAALLVAIGATYALAVPLGINQSAENLAARLGGVAALDVPGRPGGYRLHFDPDTFSALRVRETLADLVWHEETFARRLGVRPGETVEVYLYPDADTKGALLGSRETSVVPVWLARPQIHQLQDRIAVSLGHELAHVVAREWAPPPLRAPIAVGLIEGLAVAVEPPDGLPPPEQTVAAGLALDDAGGLGADPAAVAVATLSPVRFWTSRAGVAYATSGAFVGWLLDRFGPRPLRRAYATGDVAAAYGVPADSLAADWARHLRTVSVSDEARAAAAWQLRQPSLFEVRCPHHTPAWERLARQGAELLETPRGAGRAAERFERALADRPTYEPAVVGWVRARAAASTPPLGRADLARVQTDSLSGPAAFVALGDARRLAGRPAGGAYAEALRLLPPYASETAALLRRRAALPLGALRDLLRYPDAPQLAAERLDPVDPVLAAVLWHQAERPQRAWRAMQRACPDASLGLLRARLALLAGAHAQAEAAARSAARLARRDDRPGALAAAEALAARAAGAPRLARAAPALRSIFAPSLPGSDAPRPAVPTDAVVCPAAEAVSLAGPRL